MVNIVNEIGIDHGIVLALQSDLYNKGGADFSATDLINPPRISQLLSRHGHEISTEAADLVYILLGRTTHEMLEKMKLTLAGSNEQSRNEAVLEVLERWENGDVDLDEIPEQIQLAIDRADKNTVLAKHNKLIEKRFFANHLMDDKKYLLSGQVDEYDCNTFTISDYKVCSVWSVMDGTVKPEWEQQLNIYAYLMRKNNFKVEHLRVNPIFRDWSKSKAIYSGDNYPKSQVGLIEIPVWPLEEAEKFVLNRLKLHAMCRDMTDEMLPICTPEERWVRDNKYAAMKKGRTRAIKLFDTSEDAKAWIKVNKREGEEMYVEKRDGSSVRCLSYCSVAPFCEFGKMIIAKETKPEVK
jgi:hypothetical protein